MDQTYWRSIRRNDNRTIYVETERWFDAHMAAKVILGTDQCDTNIDTNPDLTNIDAGYKLYKAFRTGSPMHPHDPVVFNVVEWRKEFYVDPENGHDDNSGSIEFPFKTVEFAKLQQDDCIMHCGGLFCIRPHDGICACTCTICSN